MFGFRDSDCCRDNKMYDLLLLFKAFADSVIFGILAYELEN
jgi:hypothetical protein